MVTATTIKTERLLLMPLKMTHLEALFEIAKDPRSIEDYQYAAQEIEDVRQWLEPSFNNSDELNWVAFKNEQLIGFFEVYLEAEYSELQINVCRIGYFIDYREQKQGFGTELLLGVIDWLFRETTIERVEAGVTLHNASSYRILEKAGFVRDKVVKDNWEWRSETFDSVYYYLTKPSTN